MKHEIKRQDVPKIAIALALLLALGGAGYFGLSSHAARGEQQRTIAQMQRESGGAAFIDPALSPEEADEAASRQREADPNFVH